jgi:hypothetical protein
MNTNKVAAHTNTRASLEQQVNRIQERLERPSEIEDTQDSECEDARHKWNRNHLAISLTIDTA